MGLVQEFLLVVVFEVVVWGDVRLRQLECLLAVGFEVVQHPGQVAYEAVVPVDGRYQKPYC